MTARASGLCAPVDACAAEGLVAAAGCGAVVTTAEGAADAACELAAGLCANALEIASAIANTAATQMRGIEILQRRRIASGRHGANDKLYHRPNDSSIGGTKPARTGLTLGAGVTPAQGSVKPTAGFTSNKVPRAQ